MFKFGKTSKQNLKGVHPDLVKLAEKAISLSEIDFTVIQGLRTLKQQQENVKKGVSWTLNSKHLTGRAIDVVPYPVDWNDLTKFAKINEAFKKASQELNIRYRWGGDWNMNDSYKDEIKRGSYDGGHFELL